MGSSREQYLGGVHGLLLDFHLLGANNLPGRHFALLSYWQQLSIDCKLVHLFLPAAPYSQDYNALTVATAYLLISPSPVIAPGYTKPTFSLLSTPAK